ncbi:hypothetical protein BG842_09395 [Haladaptatus sp. W1]|nr:hypothetical protein BG842_09395 [Haladaptatus sp. W1]
MFKGIALSPREKTIVPLEEFEEFRNEQLTRTPSLFSAIISKSEFSLDFVEMALIVQSFNDIFGSRPLKIFFLS